MNQNHLVSILLPTFNSELYLEDCIKSILKQSYKNVELIVIDNESVDNTFKIINKYLNFIKISFFTYRTKNLAQALNFGITKCKGEFIARMDSDDLMRKFRIEKQLNFLLKNTQYLFVGTNALRFKKYKILSKPFNIFFDNTNLKLNLFFQSSFIHPTIMFRKKLIFDNNLYDNSMNECEDYDLWVRLINISKFKNLSYMGIFYRVHNNSASLKKRKKLDNFFSKLNISLLKKYNINLDDDQYALFKKINELKINKSDNFDALNIFYLNLLNVIKNSQIIHDQYNRNKVNEFISKKYFRFCIRCINIKNFTIKKCYNNNFKYRRSLLILLILMKILKIKI